MINIFNRKPPPEPPRPTPRPRAVPQPPIVVRRSVVDAADPAALVQAVVGYVNTMVVEGQYLHGELAPEAMWSYRTDYYLAQVTNGGHGQFVGNSRWAQPIIDYVRKGLAAMSAVPCDAIFDDLCKLIEADEARARAIAAGRRFYGIESGIKALDDRFFAAKCNETITPANAAWLKSLPNLEIVDDARFTERMRELFRANPHFALRTEQAERAKLEFALTDPMQVTARMLAVAARRLPFRFISHGSHDKAPDGREGMAWMVVLGQGQAHMFVFDDVALLCDVQLSDGQILTPQLRAQHERQLRAGDRSSLPLYAEMKNVEVARIPASLITEAREAAAKHPVVTAAQLLVRKLAKDEKVVSISPASKHSSGTMLWLVETAQRVAVLGFANGGATLLKLGGEPLAVLKAAELETAVFFEKKIHDGNAQGGAS